MAYAPHSIFIWIIAYVRLSYTYEVAQDNVIFTNQPCPEGQEGIFYAVDKSPTRYKHCGPAGFFWIFPCSPGTYFNQVEQACLLPPNATTMMMTTVRSQIQTNTGPSLLSSTYSVMVTESAFASPVYNSTIAVYSTPDTGTEDSGHSGQEQLSPSTDVATIPTDPSSTVEISSSTLSTSTETTTSTAHSTPRQELSSRHVTTAVPPIVSQRNAHEQQVDKSEVQHQAPPHPMFSAAEPKLFVTAGPFVDMEEYYEIYEGDTETSVPQGESHLTSTAATPRNTLSPSVMGESHSTHDFDYWEDNKAESPSIPLHPKEPQPHPIEHPPVQFPEIRVVDSHVHETGSDKEVPVVQTVDKPSVAGNKVEIPTNSVEGGQQVQQGYLPIDREQVGNKYPPSSSALETENIYEYHVASPPTNAPEVTNAPSTYEPVHQVYLQPGSEYSNNHEDVKNSQQQIGAIYQQSNSHINPPANEPEYSWPGYETDTYSHVQTPEDRQAVNPVETRDTQASQNYYAHNSYQSGAIQNPQDEMKYVKTVRPENIQQVDDNHSKHTEELVLPPSSEHQPYVPATGKAENSVRTSGSKSFPKAVTLSPMAEELKKRISEEDLASMRRVFETLASQAASRNGNAPMVPQFPVPPGGPYLQPTGQGPMEYPQMAGPPNPYFPPRPPHNPITEAPPNFNIESVCKENGTCEFNAVVETYCMHENDPTFYYQCGPSADDIGIWMLRQCPAGLQLNNEGQCGKRQPGTKNPSTKVQPQQPVATSTSAHSTETSGWSQQNVQQPLQTYEVPSANTQNNIYPTYSSTNVKGNQQVATDNFGSKQVYPNNEAFVQSLGQSANVINPKVSQTNVQEEYGNKQPSNYMNVEYPSYQHVILPKTTQNTQNVGQEIDQTKYIATVKTLDTQYPTKVPQSYENQYQPQLPQPPTQQPQQWENQYPQYPSIYQSNNYPQGLQQTYPGANDKQSIVPPPNNYQQGFQQTYSVANDKQPVGPSINNYVQYPNPVASNQINSPNQIESNNIAQVKPTPTTIWGGDQQQTKQMVIQPRNPYRPSPNAVTTVRGGSLPQAVVAKLSNLANLDNLAKMIAAKNFYGQPQPPPANTNNFVAKPGHVVPIASGQLQFPQYGTNYLQPGQPTNYGLNTNAAQIYNPYAVNPGTRGGYNAQTNIATGFSGNLQQAIAYALNNPQPIKPKNPYTNVRPQSTSRDAAPLSWNTNESSEKPVEAISVWRPSPGQRCSLLASPRAQVFSNPEDYKSFFMCVSRHKDSQTRVDPAEGIWALLQCPEDTVFNASLKVCDKSYIDSKQRRLTKKI